LDAAIRRSTAADNARPSANQFGQVFAFDKFHQSSLLRGELQNITVEVLGVVETGVLIAQVIDVKSGTVNDLLTPNRNLKNDDFAKGVFAMLQRHPLQCCKDTLCNAAKTPFAMLQRHPLQCCKDTLCRIKS
jgi:hypothetical protein